MVERKVWRVLDANANRAAEGLRALEEMARLVHEDAQSAQLLKALRHRLATTLQSLDRQQRLAARSTENDAGISSHSKTESSRQSPDQVVAAEAERVGQSLRVLEEFSKMIDEQASQSFKLLRYQAYDDLARIELSWTRHRWLHSLPLCILIDCQKNLNEYAEYLRRLAAAGAGCIQVRDKHRSDRELLGYARLAVEVMSESGGHVIVNDRIDVALAANAAGVHLGQDDLSIDDAHRISGQRLCVGISTHSIEQARQAVADGADYIGCGPSFPSQTKSFEHFPGLVFLSQVAREISIPAMAIGGIDLDNLPLVRQSGIQCVAVSAAIHRAAQPDVAVAQFIAGLL